MKKRETKPYPKNFEEFLDWFSTDDQCIKYLFTIKWPNGFVCPRCEGNDYWETKRKLYHCISCNKQTSITAGTVFEDSRKSLRLWFHVAWVMMAQKTGVSAKNLSETYGFGSYQTAWGWLTKYRSVMIRSGRERLQGRVEVDEAFIGGQKEGSRGRGAEGKTLVLVAVEGGEKQKLGRVRFRCVKHADQKSINQFIADYVEPESTVVTDGFKSYANISHAGYNHTPYIQSSRIASNTSQLEHVHLVISLVKRWLGGTHQGSVTPNHLQQYLDEYAFRFNRRLSEHRGMLFYRLIQQSVQLRPQPIKDLYVKPQDVVVT
jgi:transposase-like protein